MLLAEVDSDFVRAAPGRVPGRLIAQFLFEGRPPMTRGRVFDPLTRRHMALVADRWPRKDVDRPIFIVGIGRSGTTLLGRILAAGPRVGYLKEPKALWHAALDDEDISGFYSSTGRFVLGTDDATAGVRERVRSMYNWYAALSGSNRLVDKYPEMTYRLPFIRALFPDAKIVAIVRRPEAVIRSIVRYSAEMEDDRGNWWGVDDRKWTNMATQLLSSDRPVEIPPHVNARTIDPAERARTEWVLGATYLAAGAESIDHLIRYEDLLAAPGTTLERLCEVCELDGERISAYGAATIGNPKTSASAEDVDSSLDHLVRRLGYVGSAS